MATGSMEVWPQEKNVLQYVTIWGSYHQFADEVARDFYFSAQDLYSSHAPWSIKHEFHYHHHQ